jgi:ribonuclease R
LIYKQVDEIFAGRERAPEEVAEPLALAREIAAALRRKRLAHGALAVESSEPDFEFDERGDVTVARDEIQTESHWVIEHLMILANEQVAERLPRRTSAPSTRPREPDPASVERLVAQLESLDVPTRPQHLTPREAGWWEISRRVVEYQVRPARAEALMCRSCCALKQAVYANTTSATPAGEHRYCHFTRRSGAIRPARPPRLLRRSGGGGAPAGARGWRRVQRDRARGGDARARRRRHLPGLHARANALRGGPGARVRGEVRPDRRAAFVSFDRGDGGRPPRVPPGAHARRYTT